MTQNMQRQRIVKVQHIIYIATKLTSNNKAKILKIHHAQTDYGVPMYLT